MKFKVYVDYTTEEIPRPFYVGKGSQQRLQRKTRNNLHTRISLKYGYDRQVFLETDDEELAFEKERELIKEFDTFLCGGGWGANFTMGGEGVSGIPNPRCRGETHPMYGKKHSDESKRKNSESNKIATSGEKNGMFGKHHNETTRKKLETPSEGGITQKNLR